MVFLTLLWCLPSSYRIRCQKFSVAHMLSLSAGESPLLSIAAPDWPFFFFFLSLFASLGKLSSLYFYRCSLFGRLTAVFNVTCYSYFYRLNWNAFPITLMCFLVSVNVQQVFIMSCRQHGCPWPSVATFPYRSSPLEGFLGYIPYPHIAAMCMF